MRALVKTSAGPGLTARTCPDPTAEPNKVIVKVKATSRCGPDAPIYNWDPWAHSRIHPPRIIGHEMCGEVVDVGKDVTRVKLGDYVAAESHITCGHCFQCRTGQARIRVQMSAAHTRTQLQQAIGAFEKVGRELGVI